MSDGIIKVRGEIESLIVGNEGLEELCIYRDGDINDKILLLDLTSAFEGTGDGDELKEQLTKAKQGDQIEVEFESDPFWTVYMTNKIHKLTISAPTFF